MLKDLTFGAIVGLTLLPATTMAAPVKLKLAFYTSDRASVYQAAVRPFVEAVNAEAKGRLEIEVHFSGALGKLQIQQPQLVLDGTADMAFVIPGMTPDRFPDNVVVELPGLFQNMREATLTYTRLVAAGRLRGYEDFHVIGAYGSELESFHTRSPVTALDDLRGKRIRANNSTEAMVLDGLGAQPAVMPVNAISEAISSGNIEGAMVPMSMLFEFGIARVASHHYLLQVSSAPLALLMSRRRFEELPSAAQGIIRKYSSEWAAERFIEIRAAVENQVMQRLKSDARRSVVLPSPSDLHRAELVFRAVTEAVAGRGPRNGELLQAAEAEIAKVQASE